MRFVFLSAAVLSSTFLCLPYASAAPVKVACVGDSITQNSGWSDKLGAKLGAGYTSTNYGVSGTTLLKKGDHPYWSTPQFTQSHSANPDVVVIMLGTNDSKPFNWNAHKGEFVGDYEALIDSYAALPSHPKIYLNLCPPAGTNSYQIVGSVIESEVIPDIEQIAAAKGVPTIDVFTAFGGHTLDPSLYGSSADLVHPNAKGAQVIADTVYAALTAVADGGTDAAVVADGSSADATVDAAPGRDAGAPDLSGAAGMTGSAGTSGAAGSVATTGAGGSSGAGGNAGTSGVAGSSGSAGASGAAGISGGAGAGGAKASGSGGCTIAPGGGPASWALVALASAVLALRRARRRAS
jgi:lysophospholipase L1-like esterase